MTPTSKTQTRGNCPCCGRDQAVLASGRMSKHGYTVEQGWFQGVCPGHAHPPMQVQREVTERVVSEVRAQVILLGMRANALAAGTERPQWAIAGRWPREEQIPFETASPAQQKVAVEKAIRECQIRAAAGTNFADKMELLLNQVHGQPLRQVPVGSGPEPIAPGEKRLLGRRGVVSALRIERGRVYWADEKGFRGWTGTQAWRKLPLAE